MPRRPPFSWCCSMGFRSKPSVPQVGHDFKVAQRSTCEDEPNMVIPKAKLHKSHTNHTKSLWEWEQGYSVQELFKKQQENNKHPFMTIIDNPNLFAAVLKLYFCIWQNTLPVKKSSSSACEGLFQQHASRCHAWKVDRIDRLHQSRLFPEWDATLYYRNSPTARSLPGDPIWSKKNVSWQQICEKKMLADVTVHGISS